MSSGLRRGEIYRVRQPQHGDPKKLRCFAVVSRQDLLDSKANRVLCAPINMSGVGLSTEVQVGVEEGLKHNSVINCDQITRLEKSMLTDYIGALSLAKLKQLRNALVGVGSFLLPKVTVGFPVNYRASCQFPLLKQDVATPDF